MEEIIDFAQKLKVLYVEDNPEARVSMVGFLSNIFKDITTATNGEEGLDKFRQNRDFNLIITDINMPKMNGIDMIKKIRDEDNNVSILIFSAHDESEYLIESSKLNIDAYLYKPLEVQQFIDAISKIVKKIRNNS